MQEHPAGAVESCHVTCSTSQQLDVEHINRKRARCMTKLKTFRTADVL